LTLAVTRANATVEREVVPDSFDCRKRFSTNGFEQMRSQWFGQFSTDDPIGIRDAKHGSPCCRVGVCRLHPANVNPFMNLL